MNPEQLLHHFDRISEAPDAVARLRRFVLDLAVRGKLVEQDSDDEPAGELLKRIQVEKRQQAKQGKLEKTTTVAHSQLDPPLLLPSSWAHTYLGEVTQYGLPNKIDSSREIPADTWVLDLEDIEKDTSRLIERVTSSNRAFRSTKTIFQRGDVLFGKLRPYLNKVLVADQDGVCTTEIVPIRGYCDLVPDYTKLVLKSPLTMERVDRLMYGMKMPRLGTGDAATLNYPLPPIAEQHRIVAKVDELMALCDQLEAAKNEREARRDRLVAASLYRIGNATQPSTSSGRTDQAGGDESVQAEPVEALAVATRFHLNHLPRLTTRPEHIKQLRQAILNLAVRGRLVPQDPNDEPAVELLKLIRAEKEGGTPRCQETMKGKDYSLGAFASWYVLPLSWVQVRFDEIATITGGVTLGRKLGGKKTISLPYLRVANVKRWEIDLGILKEVSISEDELERYLLRDNDLLMTEGGDWDKVGRAAIWRGELPCCLHQNHIFRARMNSPILVPRWFELYFNSPAGRDYFAAASKQTTNLASINMRQVRGCPVPIPPLAEQHRIVAKVDELMTLCDQLEAQLTTTQTDSRRLLEAVLRDALAPASDMEEAAA